MSQVHITQNNGREQVVKWFVLALQRTKVTNCLYDYRLVDIVSCKNACFLPYSRSDDA